MPFKLHKHSRGKSKEYIALLEELEGVDNGYIYATDTDRSFLYVVAQRYGYKVGTRKHKDGFKVFIISEEQSEESDVKEEEK